MAKSAKKKTARKPNAAFMKPVTPSATLAEIVGSKPIPRTEVTKKLWAYIKKNKLQDAKNKRMIAQGRVRREGHRQHVRNDEAGVEAPEVKRPPLRPLKRSDGGSREEGADIFHSFLEVDAVVRASDIPKMRRGDQVGR